MTLVNKNKIQTNQAVFAQPAERIYFIDNLRVFLTLLVVAHHAIITYSGTGGWYYKEGRQDFVTQALSGIFCATNQAFFMAFFFMIAGFFTVSSLDKKSNSSFLKDRFLRLGIPIIVYDLFIHPTMIYAIKNKLNNESYSFLSHFIQYLKNFNQIARGPLWFLSALLIFSLAYICVRYLFPKKTNLAPPKKNFPNTLSLIVFSIICGLASFVIRLWMPAGEVIKILGFQMGYFVLYIALFAAGIIAYRQNWFFTLSEKIGKRWFAAIQILIILLPVGYILGGVMDERGAKLTMGGMNGLALFYAMWEPFVCVGICAGLTVQFRKYLNKRTTIQQFLAKNAYTVFIIHAPVLVFVALAMRPVMFHPLAKFVILYITAVPICYILAHGLRRIPFVDRIL
ncbi:acyltransferase [bacterium]|nr:acyltransferase [bacterium]